MQIKKSDKSIEILIREWASMFEHFHECAEALAVKTVEIIDQDGLQKLLRAGADPAIVTTLELVGRRRLHVQLAFPKSPGARALGDLAIMGLPFELQEEAVTAGVKLGGKLIPLRAVTRKQIEILYTSTGKRAEEEADKLLQPGAVTSTVVSMPFVYEGPNVRLRHRRLSPDVWAEIGRAWLSPETLAAVKRDLRKAVNPQSKAA